MNTLRTLPQIANARGLNLDELRKLIRGNAELQALGMTVGANKGYSTEEQERIVDTLQKWKNRRHRKAAVAK